MKKLCLFILPIFLFVSIFSFCNIDSFAIVLEPESTGWSNGLLRFNHTVTSSNINTLSYDIIENSAYDRSGLVCYYANTFNSGKQEKWIFCTVKDLINGFYHTQGYFATATYEIYNLQSQTVVSSTNQTWTNNEEQTNTPFGWSVDVWVNEMFTTDFPVFASQEKANDYFRYGLLDEDSIRYGSEYLSDTHYTEQVYDPIQIPAPHMEWVTDANGAFTHKIHFLNNGYFGEHNTQLNYGLLFYMHWNSVGGGVVSLNSTNAFSQDYQFTITDYIMSEQVGIYPTPTLGANFNFDDYKCPPYLDLDVNGLSVNNFNSLLSNYPISNREFTYEQGFNNAQSVMNQIKTGLSSISYSYNAPVVAAQYFVIDEDNKMIKGPISKMTIKIPNPSYFNNMGLPTTVQPSEDQDFNPDTDQPINPPVVINPPGAENPGVVNPYPVPDYSSVDADNLVDNMGSLFSLVGQVPSFIAQLFSFLPEWLIVFIAVSIGLVVAIGVVKLFLG